MKYPRLFGRLYNTPLMLLPDKAAVLDQVLRTHLSSDLAIKPDAQSDSQRASAAVDSPRKPYQIAGNGVAVVPVMGTLVQRGSYLDAMSGLTSYDRIAMLVDSAVRDPDVRAILLDVDSPGGEVNGLFTLTDRLRTAAASKPLWAYANEQAFSAAYAIAVAADRIYLPRTGGVGSIGVIAMHVDQSKRDSAQGYVYTPIFAGDKKADGNSHAPLSDGARTDLQAEIDRLYGMFVDHVATRRSLERQAVIDTQAGLLNADVAVAGRFADGVASLDEVVAMLSDAARPQTQSFSLKGNIVPQQAQTESENITAVADGGVAKIAADARKDERERIGAILDLPQAQGREALARKLALSTDMDAATAATLLDAAPAMTAVVAQQAAAANQFAVAMAAVANPAVGADAPAIDHDDPAAKASALIQKVLSAGQPKVGA